MVHTHFAQTRSVIARLARLGGGHVDEQGAARHGLGGALVKQHLADDRAVFEEADGDVGLGCGFAGTCARNGAVVGQQLGFARGAVPGVDWEAGLEQAPADAQAHQANAKQGDAWV